MSNHMKPHTPQESDFISTLELKGTDRVAQELRAGIYGDRYAALAREWLNTQPSAARETVMGDKISVGGDVTASALGSHSSVSARDVSLFKQRVDASPALDGDVKQALKQAREELARADLAADDAGDATDDLEKLAVELQKPDADPSRVQRFWGRIKDIAPPVAAILSGAAAIAKLLEQVQ